MSLQKQKFHNLEAVIKKIWLYLSPIELPNDGEYGLEPQMMNNILRSTVLMGTCISLAF